MALMIGALLMTSVEVQAQTRPGCSPEFNQIQKNHAMAQLVKGDAITKEIIERPDSVSALSCMDQALAESAKAGNIFSDQPPTFLPAFNPAIAIGLGASIGGPFGNGTTDLLANQIGGVVEPVLDNLLGGFTNALSAAFGGVLGSTFGGFLSGLVGGALGGLLGTVSASNFDCTVGQELWDDAVVGQGRNQDVGFVSFEEFLSVPPAWGDTSRAVLNANTPILDSAQDDLDNMNIPGFYTFSPIVPVIPPDATVGDVVSRM